ncbi:MAG: c-type cytochrome [Bryobacteraceae bacterium]
MRILILLVAMMLPLLAQQPPEGAKPAHPEPKNLKIITAEQIGPVMKHFRQALGVECTFCHVKGDFASDENHHKSIARSMMMMTKEINGKFPDGNMHHVTCYTCHRGAETPATQPPAAVEGEKK